MSTTNHTVQMTSCPQCRTDVRPEMVRCRQCGTLLHEPQSADASTGSRHGEKPQTKITASCQHCGEEMRPGMLRCRNCGHLPHGAKPCFPSVKLADSASWAADLFNSVHLEMAPVTPSVKLADSASWAADLFNSVPLEEVLGTRRPTVPVPASNKMGGRPEKEKPVPAPPHQCRL